MDEIVDPKHAQGGKDLPGNNVNGGRAIAIGTTTAGAGGVGIGVLVANADATTTIVEALARLLNTLDPNVTLVSGFTVGVAVACWLRTGQFRADISKQFGMLSALRDLAVENRGQNHRIMDKLRMPIREADESVQTDRRNGSHE